MSTLTNGQYHLPQESPIIRYIKRIKNDKERDYAWAYLNSILYDRPEPDHKDFAPLSYEQAQCVRLFITAERLKIEAEVRGEL